MDTMDVGELLYEYTAKVTGLTEYGVSFEALMAGTTPPPPEGARFDIRFEGPSIGPRLKGTVTGGDADVELMLGFLGASTRGIVR